jgi:DNA repair and recombination RAD54-like protein
MRAKWVLRWACHAHSHHHTHITLTPPPPHTHTHTSSRNAQQVLIVSYETFRMHAERFQVAHSCDLLICDEVRRSGSPHLQGRDPRISRLPDRLLDCATCAQTQRPSSCAQAHRLKNDATRINRALDSLPCRRRVLLTGTPMQNKLEEFFAMVDFCNPGALGAPTQVR